MPASRSVVIVSQDPHTREEGSFGFPQDVNVVLASDSRTALPLIESAAADVVVVEIRSGSAGGFDLAREMSQRLATSSIPILMLLERPQDEWLARQAGASGIEVKPIDARELALSALALIRDAQPVNN